MYITDSQKKMCISIATYKYGNIFIYTCVYKCLCVCVCVCGDRGARINDIANGVKCEQQVNLGKENLGSLWNIFIFTTYL